MVGLDTQYKYWQHPLWDGWRESSKSALTLIPCAQEPFLSLRLSWGSREVDWRTLKRLRGGPGRCCPRLQWLCVSVAPDCRQALSKGSANQPRWAQDHYLVDSERRETCPVIQLLTDATTERKDVPSRRDGSVLCTSTVAKVPSIHFSEKLPCTLGVLEVPVGGRVHATAVAVAAYQRIRMLYLGACQSSSQVEQEECLLLLNCSATLFNSILVGAFSFCSYSVSSLASAPCSGVCRRAPPPCCRGWFQGPIPLGPLPCARLHQELPGCCGLIWHLAGWRWPRSFLG